MSIRCGSIGYAHSRGLGHLLRDFHRHGVIQDILVVKHPKIPMHEDWYPGSSVVDLRRIDSGIARNFVKTMDVMLFFESPFDWNLLHYCKQIGVKTALVCMYECSQARLPYHPDLFLCPSLLDMEYFPHRSLFLPLPVSEEVVWRQRDTALHYTHNGGYLGLRGREGTENLIDAMRFVRSPLRLTIRVQENVSAESQRKAARDSRIEYLAGTVPFEDLHTTGDVYVAPQKFNGCSLPLQEARAAGMLVMTTNRFPMNTWLPTEPLIPVSRYQRARVGGSYNEFKEAIVDPSDIALMMDRWHMADIADYSQSALEWRRSMSWEVLGPKYVQALEELTHE